jgi:hypothetical protein
MPQVQAPRMRQPESPQEARTIYTRPAVSSPCAFSVPADTASKATLVVKCRTDGRACIPEAPKVDGADPDPDGGPAPGASGHGQSVGTRTVAYLEAGPCQAPPVVTRTEPLVSTRLPVQLA